MERPNGEGKTLETHLPGCLGSCFLGKSWLGRQVLAWLFVEPPFWLASKLFWPLLNLQCGLAAEKGEKKV